MFKMSIIITALSLATSLAVSSAWAGNASNSPVPGKTESSASQQQGHDHGQMMNMGHMQQMMPMMGQRIQMMQQMMAQMHAGAGGGNHNQMQHMQEMMKNMHSGGGCPMHSAEKNADPHAGHKN